MKYKSKAFISSLVFGVLATCFVSVAKADYTFINNAGAPQTDFHFTVIHDFLDFDTDPWGHAFSVVHTVNSNNINQYDVSYQGSAILAGGSLTFRDSLATSDLFFKSGAYSNFYWTPSHIAPTPEPETYAMMMAGLGMVGTIIRRRKAAVALTAH